MKLVRGRKAKPRVFVLGLDGTPHSYLKAEASAGHLPNLAALFEDCLLYTSPSPRDRQKSRMPSSA